MVIWTTHHHLVVVMMVSSWQSHPNSDHVQLQQDHHRYWILELVSYFGDFVVNVGGGNVTCPAPLHSLVFWMQNYPACSYFWDFANRVEDHL